jgi:hypothetical protein
MELSKEQFENILAYLGELPAKHANPLINYLDKINKEQEVKSEEKP